MRAADDWIMCECISHRIFVVADMNSDINRLPFKCMRLDAPCVFIMKYAAICVLLMQLHMHSYFLYLLLFWILLVC